MNSPRLEGAKGTGLDRLRGRNRKKPSEQPLLLAVISLSTGPAMVLRNYCWTRRIGANTKGLVRLREVAGIEGRRRSSRWGKNGSRAGLFWASNLIQPLNQKSNGQDLTVI